MISTIIDSILVGRTRGYFITVRNSSYGKVMFSQVCVKNSDHRAPACLGRGLHGSGGGAFMGHTRQGGMHDRGCAWQGDVCGWGGCVGGACVAGGHAW